MLEIKGVDFKLRNLVPGTTPLIRLFGFSGSTAPALSIDGRRVQPSLAISRELEKVKPEPPLFPEDPVPRRSVEEAEQWNDSVLQDLSRRMFIWGLTQQSEARRWMLRLAGVPIPALMAGLTMPFARTAARQRGVNASQVRQDLRSLPGLLDHVEVLMREGTIGGSCPNAADLQIAASVRQFALFTQVGPAVEPRPAGQLAQRLFPTWPGPSPIRFPDEWLPARARGSS